MAQDYFVYDLAAFHGLTVLRNNDPTKNLYPSLSSPPDLIISHNPDHDADRRFIGLWGSESPVAVHLHCQFNYYMSRDDPHAVAKFSNRENIRFALAAADLIMVPSNFLADELRQSGLSFRPNAHIKVVSNGARQSLYYPSNSKERARFKDSFADTTRLHPHARQGKIPMDQKLVGFVGRLDDSKGLQLIQNVARANAAGSLTDTCLLLQYRYQAGPTDRGVGKEYEDCRRKAEFTRTISPRFVWLYADSCPRAPNRPMRHFDILLLPSLSEVQPMVVLEALSCGVPVIATYATKYFDELESKLTSHEFKKVSFVSKRLNGGNGGILSLEETDNPQQTAADLVKAMESISIPDDDARIALSLKARGLGYSDARMYSEYLACYEAAIELFQQRSLSAGQQKGRQ
ncbi:glycosyltransferase family 4 protein [Bradyrhizobium liaoningense]|uniref:glycosyltransferase family 4 protein n=1 Tax=Bradyrhizobium liaoningense TaxID=43992 RepID=UPI00138ADDCD|nr:glycosyltransferase family 4 protein [Bradyrhizobium liaoningense]